MGKGKVLSYPNSKKSKKTQKRALLIIFLLALIILLGSCLFSLISHANQIESSTSTKIVTHEDQKQEPIISDEAPVIAYAISLTSCGDSSTLVDGAATLAHSIHLNSIRNTDTASSKYDYKLYAFFHTSIFEGDGKINVDENKCASILKKIGYEIKVVDIPVPLSEIESEYLRKELPTNGCCGEKEFIKLWSYTLIEHPFVVHLDLDTIIMKPMDELFDFGLHGTPLTEMTLSEVNSNKDMPEESKKDVIMWKKDEQNSIQNWSQINAFFTRDYNMVSAGQKPAGVQGGFIIVRPSIDTFSDFQSIIRKGDFQGGKGWGGLGYFFYGAMTFQGIIPYYYDSIKPDTAIELNRCVYNTMAENPRDKLTVNNIVDGKCLDGRKDCEDCRERDIGDVRTAHFTICEKPWECLPHSENVLQQNLCRELSVEWYRIRADLELSWVNKKLTQENAVVGNGSFRKDHFRGFCKSFGRKGYIPMIFPDL